MLREVLHLTKGDLTNVIKPLHVKKKALPNAGKIMNIGIPLNQLLKQKLKEIEDDEKIKQNYDECDEYFYRQYRDNFSKITIVGIKGE